MIAQTRWAWNVEKIVVQERHCSCIRTTLECQTFPKAKQSFKKFLMMLFVWVVISLYESSECT